MKLNKFAYLYSKPLGNHTLKIMKKIPGNLLKNLEKSWKYHGILSVRKSGNPGPNLHNSKQQSISLGCLLPASVATTRCQHCTSRCGYLAMGCTLPGAIPCERGIYRLYPPPLERTLGPGIPTSPLPWRGPGPYTDPPPVNRHTLVKTLPSRSFIGGL